MIAQSASPYYQVIYFPTENTHIGQVLYLRNHVNLQWTAMALPFVVSYQEWLNAPFKVKNGDAGHLGGSVG